jgi:hypothetical protein
VTYVPFSSGFCITDLKQSRDGDDVASFEAQWQSAIDTFLMDNDLDTLQCLVLAQIYSLLKGDYSRVLKYKGLAVSLSQRLGLHQSEALRTWRAYQRN